MRPILGQTGSERRPRSSRMSWPWSGHIGIARSRRPAARRACSCSRISAIGATVSTSPARCSDPRKEPQTPRGLHPGHCADGESGRDHRACARSPADHCPAPSKPEHSVTLHPVVDAGSIMRTEPPPGLSRRRIPVLRGAQRLRRPLPHPPKASLGRARARSGKNSSKITSPRIAATNGIDSLT